MLAAGLGTRLRPFTVCTPKPLMPVWGESMLSRVIAMLRERGVEDIVVNCHYLHAAIEDWCAKNGCRASYEKEILGTGGVLNPLREWIGDDEFYLVNGDIVVENVPELKFAGDELGVCLVTESGPRTIEVEPEYGYVTNWKSDDAGFPGTFTYCGIALLRPEILEYVAPEGSSSIVSAYEKAMMNGRFVRAMNSKDALWTDAGTVESYLEINRDGEDNAFGELPQLKAAGFSGKIDFIGARGSDRVFFRAPGKVAVVYDDEKRAENARYAAHAKFLKSVGAPVPEVLVDLPDLKTLVLEDAGAERKMTLEEYVKVVEALAAFNAIDASGLELEAPFDAKLYRWERELFAEHCLFARFRRELPKAVADELAGVASTLEREPLQLVHRDFQSTNVLWRGEEFKFIDFQGMRLGPAIYDLASLVYDPYVEFSEGERRALIALYAKKSGRAEIPEKTPFAAVERLVQCLGAYGRLSAAGKTEFSKYVLPALENLLTAADEAGLEATGALAEELIHLESHSHGHHHDGECHCHDHHR